MSRERVSEALRFDPLEAAEQMTGQSYKDDDATSHLGLALAIQNNARKEELLRERADSYFGMDFAASLMLFADLGFTEVFRETFDGRDVAEQYVILWHPDGILATCESYRGTHRNAAKVYYNYRHKSGGYPGGGLTSSGQMVDGVWVGDHDAREGVRHNLNAMRAEGEFLPVWHERPWLWLLNYAEESGDYEAVNEAKVSRLPEHVRCAITPAVSS